MGVQRFFEKWMWEYMLVLCIVVLFWDRFAFPSEEWTDGDFFWLMVWSAVITHYVMREPYRKKLVGLVT